MPRVAPYSTLFAMSKASVNGVRRLDDREQLLVRNDDQGINLLAQFFNALIGLAGALLSFTLEGTGDNAHNQRAQTFRNIADQWTAAGSRASAHAGSHKHHVASGQGTGDFLPVFLHRTVPDDRIRSRTQATGQIFADLNLVGRLIPLQGLQVGVHSEEINAVQPFFDHAVDSVAAAAAHADDTDLRSTIESIVQFDHRLFLLWVRD